MSHGITTAARIHRYERKLEKARAKSSAADAVDRLEKKVRRAVHKVTKLEQARTEKSGKNSRNGARGHVESDLVNHYDARARGMQRETLALETGSVADGDDSWGSASDADGPQPHVRVGAAAAAIALAPNRDDSSAAPSADDDSWGSEIGEEIPARLRSSSTVTAATNSNVVSKKAALRDRPVRLLRRLRMRRPAGEHCVRLHGCAVRLCCAGRRGRTALCAQQKRSGMPSDPRKSRCWSTHREQLMLESTRREQPVAVRVLRTQGRPCGIQLKTWRVGCGTQHRFDRVRMQDDSWDSDASSCDKPRTQVFVRAGIGSARFSKTSGPPRANNVRVLCSFAQATALAPDDDDQWTDDEEPPPNMPHKAGPFLFRLPLMPSSRPYCPKHPSS